MRNGTIAAGKPCFFGSEAKMRKKDESEKARKISISVPAHQLRQVKDILDENSPLATTTSAIYQAALKDWLNANAEQYEALDEEGGRVIKTRLKRGAPAAAKPGQPPRRRFEDVIDPFSGVF